MFDQSMVSHALAQEDGNISDILFSVFLLGGAWHIQSLLAVCFGSHPEECNGPYLLYRALKHHKPKVWIALKVILCLILHSTEHFATGLNGPGTKLTTALMKLLVCSTEVNTKPSEHPPLCMIISPCIHAHWRLSSSSWDGWKDTPQTKQQILECFWAFRSQPYPSPI